MRKIVSVLLLFLLFEPISVHAQTRTTTQTAATYKYSEKFLNDPAVQSYVESVTWRLVGVAKQQGVSIARPRVLVGSTSAIQSVSGRKPRYVGITRGMLNVILNEAELACIISHEIGHQVLHSQPATAGLKPVERAIKLRDQEQEADEYGAMLCADAGYDSFSLINFLDRLAQLTASHRKVVIPAIYQTHSDFADRVTYLHQFLEKKKLFPRPDQHFSSQYVGALKSIQNYRSHDAVNELVPDVSASLISIRKKLQPYKSSGKQLPLDQFLGIMSELSQITRQNSAMKFLPKSTMDPVGSSSLFMKEVVSQDAPLWDDQNVQQEVKDILATLGRLGVGFIPVVGDAIDLYELVSGLEFGTGRKLDFQERVFTTIGLLAGSGASWREMANGIEKTIVHQSYQTATNALGEAKRVGGSVRKWEKYSPLNQGPLPLDKAKTFRSGTYVAEELAESMTLYRVYSDPARKFGQYWTRTLPSGPTQSIIDHALDPRLTGNRATEIVKIKVPPGQTIYEGLAASLGSLPGGGNQVFILHVDPAWVVR